jgi:hypothetical protein
MCFEANGQMCKHGKKVKLPMWLLKHHVVKMWRNVCIINLSTRRRWVRQETKLTTEPAWTPCQGEKSLLLPGIEPDFLVVHQVTTLTELLPAPLTTLETFNLSLRQNWSSSVICLLNYACIYLPTYLPYALQLSVYMSVYQSVCLLLIRSILQASRRDKWRRRMSSEWKAVD